MGKLSKQEILHIKHATPYPPGPSGHDALIDSVVEMVQIISKEAVVASFIDSLVTRTLYRRAALGCYAVSLHLKKHKFKGKPLKDAQNSKKTGACTYCGRYENSAVRSSYIAEAAASRHEIGGVSPDYLPGIYSCLYFFLKDDEKIDILSPDGYPLLADFLKIANNISPEAKLSNLLATTKDVIESNYAERRHVIEILGACGILQPEGHPSYVRKFISAMEKEEKRSPQHTNDWLYPTQWWRGKDGVNAEAVRFWFSELNWK